MNIDAKIFNKILANCIQHYTKKMVDHNHLRDARIIQYSRINKYSTSINNMKKKTPDHNNRWWKIFAIIQHPLMIKKIQHYGREGAYLNIIKAIYEKPTANIIISGQKIKVLPLTSRRIHWCLLSPLLFYIVLEVLATAIRQE